MRQKNHSQRKSMWRWKPREKEVLEDDTLLTWRWSMASWAKESRNHQKLEKAWNQFLPLTPKRKAPLTTNFRILTSRTIRCLYSIKTLNVWHFNSNSQVFGYYITSTSFRLSSTHFHVLKPLINEIQQLIQCFLLHILHNPRPVNWGPVFLKDWQKNMDQNRQKHN